jgi:hypothetical protein
MASILDLARCLVCRAKLQGEPGCLRCGQAHPVREGILEAIGPLSGRNRIAADFYDGPGWRRFRPWEQGFLIGGGALGRLRGSAARWTPDMPQDWVPLSGTRVAEVAYDRADNGRLRYPARLVRWRPDRDARSCTFDQFAS